MVIHIRTRVKSELQRFFPENNFNPSSGLDFNYNSKSESSNNKSNDEKLIEMLTEFGFIRYESLIYTFLTKHGSKTASQIYKLLKIPRTETYRILRGLQSKGVITASLSHPMIYTTLPINQVIQVLINQEKNRVNTLESKRQELHDLSDNIQAFVHQTYEEKGNQFQIIRGLNQINSKINGMACGTREKFLLIGSEDEFLHFYHSGIFDQLKSSDTDFKIISSNSKKTRYFLEGIKKDRFKIISGKYTQGPCFAIKDKEVILLLKNGKNSKEDITAIWSDSSSIVDPLAFLFNTIWSNLLTVNDVTKYSKLERLEKEYRFQIKELEQENIGLEELNTVLSKNL